jgi:hypothetical protein
LPERQQGELDMFRELKDKSSKEQIALILSANKGLLERLADNLLSIAD